MKRLLLVLVSALPLTSPSLVPNTPTEETVASTDSCTVQAWVRAEDLSPDHISHGELRVKVKEPHCATKVASVALRLQLLEFGEVKYLKEGAVIPVVQPAQSGNKTVPDAHEVWMGAIYAFEGRHKAMRDPDLWVIKAEERQSWTTEAILIDDNPDFSLPIVTPFIVATPAVNYPPVLYDPQRFHALRPILRHSYSDHGYVYAAVVTFIDGRKVSVEAGHTTFVPVFPPHPAPAPLKWNITFQVADKAKDPRLAKHLAKCLSEGKFVGEVTLAEGNIIRRGKIAILTSSHTFTLIMNGALGELLKGNIILHAPYGSTSFSHINLDTNLMRNDHWAHQQAATDGDTNFHVHEAIKHTPRAKELSAHLLRYASIFEPPDEYNHISDSSKSWTQGIVTPAKPSFDFEVQIPLDAPVDFLSYYSSTETLLQFTLTTLYSESVAECMEALDRPRVDDLGDKTPTPNISERTEEGMWDMKTHAGQPRRPSDDYRSQNQLWVQAAMPIHLVGNLVSSSPVEHYLKPGLPSPVLRASQNDLDFPPANPVFVEEPYLNTSARLVNNFPRMIMDGQPLPDIPDPTSRYRAGVYAGLLWRKKVVVEEKEIVSEADGSQHPFPVAL
ncbi:hypothetical protein C8J57DRAFT_1239236 [Mycena rebaudengoi]|nr:hypothetical protein C8J57DRAFT_1239236 [Mycena rebaudengoi]